MATDDGVFTVMQIGIPDFIQFDIIGQRSKSGLVHWREMLRKFTKGSKQDW